MKAAALLILFASATMAQNSDLAFLFGAGNRRVEIIPGRVQTETSGSFQINYAWQLREGPAGRLYIEMPVQFLGSASATVGSGITGAAGGSAFLLPGLRYHFAVTPRFALYGSAGAGLGIYSQEISTVSGNTITDYQTISVKAALGIGGGLDFRLSRLWSLRAEVRDMFGKARVGRNRHNVLFQFGFALHF